MTAAQACFWPRVLHWLDRAEASANHGADNIDLWCSEAQAKAELLLAFARAAFVVGDDDEVLKERCKTIRGRAKGQRRKIDDDPIDDIRETSKYPWESRYQAANKHLVEAKFEYDWIKGHVEQGDVSDEARIKVWMKQWSRWYKPVSKGVDGLGWQGDRREEEEKKRQGRHCLPSIGRVEWRRTLLGSKVR